MNTLMEGEAMKFIINGRSFDTATSTTVAISRGVLIGPKAWAYQNAEEVRYETVLYRTPNGRFWTHEHATLKLEKGKPVVTDEAEEVRPEEAVGWISREGAAILDANGLDMPEEG